MSRQILIQTSELLVIRERTEKVELRTVGYNDYYGRSLTFSGKQGTVVELVKALYDTAPPKERERMELFLNPKPGKLTRV